MSDRDPLADAREAYEKAEERRRYVLEAWEELGRPLWTTGSMGQDVAHPALKVIMEAEVLADRLRDRLAKKQRGPEPKAVLGGVPAARSAQLKAVDGGKR